MGFSSLRKGLVMSERLCRMLLSVLLAAFVIGLASSAWAAAPAKPKPKETTDPAEAKLDPDFSIQGEYLGQREVSGANEKAGAQVIALGGGKFDIVVYKGGLPGEGWKKGDPRERLQAERKDNDVLVCADNKPVGKIAGETLSVAANSGKLELKRIERKSPTLLAKPPEGAVVLFDGTSADKWEKGRLSKDNNLEAEAWTKDKFGSYSLHIELRLSYMPDARGQGRSNSGVYIHEAYEIQVLDSFGLEGASNECGGFYSIKAPDVNMCYPPLVWQTYDVDFTAPKYEGAQKVVNARMTVRHNGVVIHDNLELPKGTPGRKPEGPAPRGIYLQGHGNKVQYRNVWLVVKK